MKVEEVNWHYQELGSSPRHSFTILTKQPDSKRGEYADELDIYADTEGQAKKVAKYVLAKEYDLNLRIGRVLLNH